MLKQVFTALPEVDIETYRRYYGKSAYYTDCRAYWCQDDPTGADQAHPFDWRELFPFEYEDDRSGDADDLLEDPWQVAAEWPRTAGRGITCGEKVDCGWTRTSAHGDIRPGGFARFWKRAKNRAERRKARLASECPPSYGRYRGWTS